MLNFIGAALLLRVLVAAPAVYVNTTPVSTRQKPKFYLNLIGEFPSKAYFRIYRVKAPIQFFEKQMAGGLTIDPRVQFYSKNPVSSTIATIRRFQRNVRYYARDVISYDARVRLRDALEIGSMESKIASKQKMPPLLPKTEYELIAEWESDEEVAEFSDEVEVPVQLDDGAYLLEVYYQGVIASVPLLVTDAHLLFKFGVNKGLLYASDFNTSKPLEHAEITGYKGRKKFFHGFTDKNGMLWVDDLPDSGLITFMMVTEDSQIALAGEGVPQWRSYYLSDTLECFLFTERPIYQPGQVVYFKGVVRRRMPGHFYLNVPNQPIIVEILKGYSWNPEFRWVDTVKTDEFGSISDSLILPENAKLGYYIINLSDEFGDYITSTSFEVQRYRKPEFTVKITPDAERYASGDTAHLRFDANFLSGQPLSHAKLAVKVTRRQIDRPFWEWSHYWWWGYEEEEMVDTFSLETDGHGTASLTYAFPRDSFSYSYTFEVCAIEPSTQKLECSQKSVDVVSGEYIPTIELHSWFANVGKPFSVSIDVHDLQNNPVSCDGKLFVVKMIWEDGERVYDTVKTVNFKTNKEGHAHIRLTLDRSGSYILAVSVFDELERKTEDYTWIWVWGGGWEEGVENSIDIVAFKPDTVTSGDSVFSIFVTPFKDGYVLLTVDAEDPLWAKVVHVQNNSGNVTFKAEDKFWGYVDFTVSASYDGKFITATKGFRVKPLEKVLKVEVELDRKTYRPGDTVVARINIRDHRGFPVKADFSFAVVDEAIFILRSQDLDPFLDFYGYRPHMVEDVLSKDYNFEATNVDLTLFAFTGRGGKLLAADESEAEEAAPERQKMLSQLKGAPMRDHGVRRRFKDTAFWLGNGRTNSRGKAKIKFALPDNITKWRITVFAFTKDTKVGKKVARFVTNKDVVVRLVSPQVIRTSDTLEIATLVQNGLAARMEFEVEFAPSDHLKVFNRKKTKLSIPSHSSESTSWLVAAKTAGDATLMVSASTFRASDAMEIHVPVEPFGFKETEHVSLVADKEGKSPLRTFHIPDSVEILQSNLFVSLGPMNAIVQAVRYLKGYPYGCVEQTMSRFVPDIVASRVLSKFGVKDTTFNDLPDMIQKGLNRIYHFQHDDGGWGWWTNDETDPHMTAYVLWGLKLAQESDIRINPEVIERGVERLARMVMHEELDDDEFAEVSFVLSLYLDEIESDQALREQILDGLAAIDISSLSPTHLAQFAIACKNFGRKKLASRALKNLNSMSVRTVDGAIIWSETHYYYFERKVEPTAWALMANIELGKDGDKKFRKFAREAADGLLWLRTGNSWNTTEASAYAVLALSRYMDVFGGKFNACKIKVFVNGSRVFSDRISPRNLSKYTEPIPIERTKIYPGENDLQVEIEGDLSKALPINVSLSVTYIISKQRIKATEGIVSVERSFFRIKTVRTKSGWTTKTIPINYGDTVKLNEPILVRLTVKSKKDLRHVLLKDPILPGTDIDLGELYWKVTGLEHHIDHIAFAIYWLDADESIEIEYRIRPYLPGKFRVPPASIELMYQPEVTGHSDEMKLYVVK